MKKILFAAAVCLAMTACNKDENRQIKFLDLDITVADNGFVSEDGSNANHRTFNVGDRIGVYAVSGGALVEGFSNLCVTAYGSNDNLSWRVDDRTMEFPSNAVYYAYYPYQETLTGNVDITASNAGEFFSAIAAHWSIAEDQSGNGFNQSDLTYGSGTVTGEVLSINMEHAFGLVTAKMGGTVYTFTNTNYDIPDYTISTGLEFTDNIPQTRNGVLNYIVKPGSFSVSGTMDGEEWKFDGTAEAGHSYSFTNGESTVIEHNLQIGDFYLADGSLLSKDADASEVAAAHVIGVVCQIDPERIGEGERNALGGVAHALVLATQIYGGDAVQTNERRFFTDYALYDETENIELAVDRDEKTIGFPEVPRE
ncbi:MAG TPA: fimbrillin family protein, partial [Candidatus Coprenecus pullistercoris]|nr:fimbrillin family protein [Candidatus Coprenecus pullistercoris]